MDTLRKQQVPFVLVDGGDFIHRNDRDNVPESIASWAEMHRLGYDAVTLGEIELEQWSLVDSLQKALALPLVVSNVERQVDGQWQPVADRQRIIESNGVRIGFISAISESQINQTALEQSGETFRVLPPMETIYELIGKLRPRVDVLVLLAHLDLKIMEQYASSLPEVDVVLGGHVTRLDEAPLLVGQTILNRSGTRGQFLANTRLIVSPENEIVDFGGVNITLGPDYPEDPLVAAAAEAAKEESARLRRERTQRHREAAVRDREELRKASQSIGQSPGRAPAPVR